MTNTTEITLHDAGHGNWVATFLRQKDFGMTIFTG